MRSVDRLEQQKRHKRMKAKPDPDMEMEEEMERPRFVPLNKNKSAFDTGEGDGPYGGINTAPSIFKKTAVFHTDT